MLLTVLSYLNSLRAIVATAALFGVSPTIFLVHTSWRVISIVLPKKMFYRGEDFIWEWYQKLVVFVFESCSGMQIILKGEIPGKIENVIAICNHQSSMDWVIMDCLAFRQGMCGHMRYVFKNVLKYFPLFGYVWGVHGGIFVKRDGSYNANNMKTTLRKLVDRDVPVFLIIYPEGTRFHPGKESLLAKSQAYASENRLEPLTHVLTPRIKAFHCALSSLGDYLDAVYDTTIIYESEGDANSETGRDRHLAPSLWDVLAGRCKKVFIQFDRIPAKDVPLVYGMESPTFKWLHTRFKRKNELLKKYYASPGKNKENPNKAQIANLSDLGRRLPSADTTIASVSLLLLTGLMLCTPTGRMVYTATVCVGTVFGMVYAHFVF